MGPESARRTSRTKRSAPHCAGRFHEALYLDSGYLYIDLIVPQVVSSTGVESQCSV